MANWVKFTAVMIVLVPAMASGMSFDDARHLLNRAGFGATPTEIAEFAKLSREEGVARILATAQKEPTTTPPYWVDEPVGGLFTLRLLALNGQRGEDVRLEREAIRRKQEAQERKRTSELKAWWWNEMVQTKSPITERMTLFWHNHFTSEIDTVKSPELMYQQNATLRKHALGNFAELLLAATEDPAMIIYLDNNSNVKGNPNENFAREVMELFTLGEGKVYTEADIKEAARAFTGWRVDNVSKDFVFEKKYHDFGEKTILGKTGKFGGQDVVKILLAQERTAEFITEEAWTYFISQEWDEAEKKRIAKIFRDSKYDLQTLVRALLTSEHFWAPENRGNMIKSPADLVVGSCRMFETHPAQAYEISAFGKMLGQDLFAPPDVSGWKGGPFWIDANTLITRHQLSRLVLSKPDQGKIKRFENQLKAQKLAAIKAERERREIDRLLESQKSLLDNVLADEGFDAFGGGGGEPMMKDLGIDDDDEIAKLDKAVEMVLSGEMSPEEMVRRQFANAEAMDLQKWIKKQQLKEKELEKVLLPIEPVRPIDTMDPNEAVTALLLDPAFQLK